MSLSYVFDFGDAEAEEFWATASGAVDKICFPYADYVRIPAWEFVLEVGLVLLWVVGLVFSVLSLLTKGIRKLVCICRKKTCEISLGRWSALAASLQIGNLLLLGWVASQAFTYAVASSYVRCLPVFGILAVVMMGLAVYGVRKMRKVPMTKKRKIYNWTTVVLLVTTVANIGYWNLFMWWKV